MLSAWYSGYVEADTDGEDNESDLPVRLCGVLRNTWDEA